MDKNEEILEHKEDNDKEFDLSKDDLSKYFGQLSMDNIPSINESIQLSGVIENTSSQITDSMLSDSFKNNPIIAGGFDEGIDTKAFNNIIKVIADYLAEDIDTKTITNSIKEIADYYMNTVWQNQIDKLFFEDKTDLFFNKGWFPISEVVNQKFDDEKQNIDDFMINSIDTYLKDSEYRDVWMNHQYFRETILTYENGYYLSSSLSSFASIENILNYMFSTADTRNSNLYKKGKGESKKQLSSSEFKEELYRLLNLPINQKEMIFNRLKRYYGINRNELSHGKHISSNSMVVSKKDAAIAINVFLIVFFIAQTKQNLIQAIRQDSQFVKTVQNSSMSLNTYIQNSIDWEALSANIDKEFLRIFGRISEEDKNTEEDRNE